jgi:hypothetical protein
MSPADAPRVTVRSNPARIGAGARETVNFLTEARRDHSTWQPDGVTWLP